ncbi:hypothetical protein ACFY9N_12360 [Microbacterium sp. NPDC008134]|uniref:hypothetical protein n=1 Tax=Microbacterium sp. NPDC008134 TaxID=3364183 RepID=UPI0036E838B5
MTDPTRDPYAPPPVPGAGAPPVPPVPPAVPPVPPAPTANPLGYQPPPAPQQQKVTPYGYSAPAPAPAPVPSPAGRKQTSPKTSSIISIIAGAVSIVILPWVAGFLGIGMGVYTLRAQATARRHGVPSSGAHTSMAIIGIVLGSIGILAKLALDYFL